MAFHDLVDRRPFVDVSEHRAPHPILKHLPNWTRAAPPTDTPRAPRPPPPTGTPGPTQTRGPRPHP